MAQEESLKVPKYDLNESSFAKALVSTHLQHILPFELINCSVCLFSWHTLI